MRATIKLPRLAETTDEVVIVSWQVNVGDQVQVGDSLLTVETDKAMVVVPSPVSGQIEELLVLPDEEIVTGTAIAVVDVEHL